MDKKRYSKIFEMQAKTVWKVFLKTTQLKMRAAVKTIGRF